MKKYIGTKEVSAIPAWRIDGKVYPKDGAVPRVMNREDGYKVVYEDGYESWSPKSVFEKAYELAETPLDRMKIEAGKLADKDSKLAKFIQSGKMEEEVVDEYDRCLLRLQSYTMFEYLKILNSRIYKMGHKEKLKHVMDFGMAIQALKAGYAIQRAAWFDADLVVFRQVPAHIGSEIIPNMQSLPQSAKDIILNGAKFIDYRDQCLIYNAKTGRANNWTPSNSEVFAEDWIIVTD